MDADRIGDSPYSLELIGELESHDAEDGNIDVVVRFPDGRTFVATFFTISNLASLFERGRQSGENAGGLYVWSTDMIVVKRLSIETIERAVVDLLSSGDFETAFSPCRET